MSDFKYWLHITSSSKTDIDKALDALQEKGVIPNTLMLDPMDKRPQNDGLYHATLDTERLMPYGTSKGWDAVDHEAFFHKLSLNLPAAMFEFRGVCIDDPQNNMFLKAFHNGLYKEVWQDNSDLSERLPEVSWRLYGEPEQEMEKNDLRKVFLLTCTHETQYGYDAYSSLHSSYKAARAHVKNIKEECGFGEYGEGEHFDYDIKEHALDITKLAPARAPSKSSLSNAIADAQTRAGEQAKGDNPRPGKEPGI